MTALAGHQPFDPERVAAVTNPAPYPESAAQAPLLWPMIPSLVTMAKLDRLERAAAPAPLRAGHRDEVFAALRPVGEAPPTRYTAEDERAGFATMPTPVLVITVRNFAPNYIWSGLHYASAWMRDALALGPEAIEHREVDTSGSAPAAQAADYRVFRVVLEADPVDLARMYGYEPEREADGNATDVWILSVTGPHATPRRTVWREGFIPPAPLFRDQTGRFIATEELADRVMRAGLQHVVFQDLTSRAALHDLVFRKGAGQSG